MIGCTSTASPLVAARSWVVTAALVPRSPDPVARFATATIETGIASRSMFVSSLARPRAWSASIPAKVPGGKKILNDSLPLGDSGVARPATPTRGSRRAIRNVRVVPKAYTVTRWPGLMAIRLDRSVLNTASSPVGVGPVIPVADGSPPNPDAFAKSTSSTCACATRGMKSRPRTVVTNPSSESVPPTSALRARSTADWIAGPRSIPNPRISSSTGPSCVTADRRTDARSDSPRTLALVTIAVASTAPETTRTA